jgi:REP element-mobilizing transposase RayT
MGIPQRKAPPHYPPRIAGSLSPIIMVTVCSYERTPLLAEPEIHHMLVDVWKASKRWWVGRYVVMPDHLHLFCSPGPGESEVLSKWIGFWKRDVARRVGRQNRFWQKDFWDRQMRSGESYDSKWEYVKNNPVRHKLVEEASQWQFQGTIHCLAWHER